MGHIQVTESDDLYNIMQTADGALKHAPETLFYDMDIILKV